MPQTVSIHYLCQTDFASEKINWEDEACGEKKKSNKIKILTSNKKKIEKYNIK